MKNFNHLDSDTIIQYAAYSAEFNISAESMLNWLEANGNDPLDIVEGIAQENGLIASEQDLSAIFDDEIMPSILADMAERGVSSDQPMINEAFNNWTDSLLENGVIHTVQYNNYTYVGKWSDQ